MYFQFGQYRHASSEVLLQIDTTPLFNQRGERYGLQWNYKLSGFIQAANPAALTAALAALEAAYSRDYVDFGLYNDDGTATQHVVKNVNTLEGVKVIKGVSYPNGGPSAEYSTFRSYEIVLEAKIAIESTPYMSFHETVEITGGGPEFLYITTRNGPPQRQQVSEMTPYHAVQHGEATGQYSYPPVPQPLWPNDEHVNMRKVSRTSPERKGLYLREFKISYQYVFESQNPLFALPNTPPASTSAPAGPTA